MEPRNPKTFLEVFSGIKILDVKLEFYGPIHENVYREIKSFESENIIINNKRIPYALSIDIQREASFLLLIESGAEFSPFLPTKFVDYVNSGKPIIVLSPIKSEITRLLGSDYPFISPLNDIIQISKIFRSIEDPVKIKMAIKSINRLKNYFSEEFIVSNYSEFLKK